MPSLLSRPLVKYVLLASVRDRIFLSLFVAIVLGLAVSAMFGASAVTETDSFASVYSAGGLRLVGVVALVLFVAFYVRRSFDSRDVELLLTRPIGRVSFVLSHFVAFSLIAAIVSLPISLAVLTFGVDPFSPAWMLWAFSLLCEYVLMANTVFFFSLVLSSASMSAISAFGFYTLCRMIGEILGITTRGLAFDGYRFLSDTMHVIAFFIPRLDLMAQTSWLVYGLSADGVGAFFVFAQTLLFCMVLFFATATDLVRRQF